MNIEFYNEGELVERVENESAFEVSTDYGWNCHLLLGNEPEEYDEIRIQRDQK